MILESLARQQHHIAADLSLIRQLREIVEHPTDLTLPQYLCWYALVLDFKPDVIIELGRGYGNSTALFTLASHRIANLTVHSFDLRQFWELRIQPKLARATGEDWFAPLTVHTGDLTAFDFTQLLADKRRIIVLLDAHGIPVAERLLSHIMPIIAERPHLILCHDISDNRFDDESQRLYNGRRLWQGMDDWYDNQASTAYVNLGWATGIVDQIIPLLDFTHRNRIALHSADHEFTMSATREPESLDVVTRSCSEITKNTRFHFAWFSLNEGTPPFSFPAALPGGIRLRTKAKHAWLRFIAYCPTADRLKMAVTKAFNEVTTWLRASRRVGT